MTLIVTWIKKEFGYLKDSFMEIVKGFFLFILASFGLGSALFLRYLGYNGTFIIFTSIIIEFISLLLCYFIFRGYLKQPEEKESSKQINNKS
ncbi:MAG: hypothetical protein ACFFB0_17000 [Promethearchaeota archaeon]